MALDLNSIGASKEAISNTEEQKVQEGFKVLPSGVYKAEVVDMGTYTTKDGAVQLKIGLKIPSEDDRILDTYHNLKMKNGEENKWGNATFRYVVEAMNLTFDDLDSKKGSLKVYKNEVEDSNIITGFQGKEILALVRQTVDESNPEFKDGNEIEGWARLDGTNAQGTDLVKPFEEKIANNPIKFKKGKGGAKAAPTGEAGTAAKEKLKSMI